MSTSRPVSIILPTRNRAIFLPLCIDSILHQSYSNWELIIIDDASTDETPLIAKEYEKKDLRIRYRRNFSRQGLPMDRNIGISNLQGDLVFFVEDDLILEHNCVEILVNTFEDLKSRGFKVGAVSPRMVSERKDTKEYLKRIWDYVGDSKRKKMHEPYHFDGKTGVGYVNWELNADSIQEIPNAPSCSLLDKNAIKSVGGYEEKAYKGTYILEETDFYFRLRKKGYKLYFQPKAVVHHKKSDVGGCNVNSQMKYYYYFLRNHVLFVIRNFGWKSMYMVPFFWFFILYKVGQAALIISIRERSMIMLQSVK